MTEEKKSLLDSALYPDPDKKTKLPLWVHYVLRFSLIGLNIALTVYLWYNIHYFYSVIVGIVAIYQVAILFYGSQIRAWIIEEMGNYY